MATPTVDQLRDNIDSGKTGEKVGYPDPAAAPLGTDAEAGGSPPTRAERRIEAGTQPRRGPLPAPSRPVAMAMMLAVIAAVMLLVLFAGWMGQQAVVA